MPTNARLIEFLVSAVAAAIAVYEHRMLTKKTATLQVILSDTSDPRIVEASSRVYKMIQTNKNFYEVLIQQNSAMEDVEALKIILNRYEFYATGINKGILDDDLLKTLYFSNFITFWKHAKSGIMDLRLRNQRETLFQEFEKVMKNWEKHPLHKNNL